MAGFGAPRLTNVAMIDRHTSERGVWSLPYPLFFLLPWTVEANDDWPRKAGAGARMA